MNTHMKFAVFFIFIAQSFLGHYARADASMKILGHPIENKKTHEMIAFQCLGQDSNCSMIYAIKINPSGERTPLGLPILTSVNGAIPTEIEIKEAYRKITKEYKKVARKAIFQKIGKWNQGGLELIGLFGTIVVAGITASILPIAAGVTLYLGGRAIVMKDLFFVPNYNPTLATLNDQKGWNWAIESKTVSNRAFNRIASNLNDVWVEIK